MVWDDVRAIVFDLDGVILESGDIKTQAFLDLFAQYPQFRRQILAYHLTNLGVSRYDKFDWIYRELLHKKLGPAERTRLGEEFSGLVLQKILTCPFVPGACEALRKYHLSKLLFVASGTPQDELDLILTRRGISNYLAGAWGSPRKKAEIVNGMLERYELTPSQVLFIGDGSSDYEAAQETGVHFVARETPELKEYWNELGVDSVPNLLPLTAVRSTLVTI
jgi:phosphoglycolate phosphatase-like HAD superfamily hydrolase